MLLLLLLACNHERVDLGETGASGSAPPPKVEPEVPPFVPAVAKPAQPSVVIQNSGPAVQPMTPGPLLGVPSRTELLPPISGGTLAVAADGSMAVAADPDRDALYLIDVPKRSVKTLPLAAASEPGRVVLDELGQAHVVLRNKGVLARVQLKTAELTQSEPICRYPRGLAYHAATHTLHAACADGQLVTLDAADHSIVTREQHLSDLRDVVFGVDDTPIVTRFRSAGLLTQTQGVELEIRPPGMPRPKVDTNVPDVPQVSLVSTRATFAFRTAAAPDGTLWMLHERAQQDVIPDDRYVDSNLNCGPVVQVALTHWDGSKLPVALDHLQLNGVTAPAVDLAISPSGRFIAIATPGAYVQGNSSVQLSLVEDLKAAARIQPERLNEKSTNDVNIACFKPELVQAVQGSQAVAVAFDGNDRLYVQNRFPARLNIMPVIGADGRGTSTGAAGSEQIMLDATDVRDAGHEWFHAELGKTRVSCAACHAEGMDDGHTWQSATNGRRRTPSLRGGFTETAPFGWQGEYASADAVIQEMISKRLNVHSVPAEAIQAMTRWLDRLPALSLPASPAAESGKALFESAELGCSTCHFGPKLTDNNTRDVGTGEHVQVPSLLGLGLRAPYYHDGCAKDLDALFTHPECAHTGHAVLTELDSDRALQLRAYLESL
jgi:hypothetical protein